jgi:hypothetical protein
MLEFLGVNVETDLNPEHSNQLDKKECDDIDEVDNFDDFDDVDEFNEYNAKEEPSLATKNVTYTLLSDAHYERKNHLQREFGPITAVSDDEFEKDKVESESEDSESSDSGNEYFHKNAAIDML